MLDREEYVEQGHFFRVLSERLAEGIPIQELFVHLREEVLASTKLPMAIDFLLSELIHIGTISSAMSRLSHYFTPFQAYMINAAEDDGGRIDMRISLQVLAREAEYRGSDAVRTEGLFLYQFETLCRNRLRYDHGLDAIAADPDFGDDWTEWIHTVRRQIGLIDFANLVYVRSEHYRADRDRRGLEDDEKKAVLFGEKEGRIALANIGKDPLFLFSALQRHLAYPSVPRPTKPDLEKSVVPALQKRLERLETRLKFLEDEQRKDSIDLTKFYSRPENHDK
ncbi:MAG: hypothetical protein ACI9G1_000352 [Pirellulaceae bacterium]|jgi:hypothetical protein